MTTEENPVLCLLCGRRRPVVGLACGKCWDTLEWRLNDIQALYALLPAMVIPGGAGTDDGGGKPAKRDAGPLPGREVIMNLMGRTNPDDSVHMDPGSDSRLDQGGPLPTAAVLELWSRMVAEERGLAARSPQPTVTSEASFLRRHLNWICEQDWVDDFNDEIARAHNVLRDVAGEHRPKPIGTCPVVRDPDDKHPEPWLCEETLWVSTHGSLVIQCRSCKTTWDQDHWKILGNSMGPLKRPNAQSVRVESAV